MRNPIDAVPRRRGAAYVAVLTLLALFGSVGLALATLCATSLQKGDNHRNATEARLAAESGLSFLLWNLDPIRLSGLTDEATFATNLAASLGRRLDGTPNLAGQTVAASGQTVTVPDVYFDNGSFRASVSWTGADRCRAEVRGTSHALVRRISVELALTSKQPAVFDYGVASKGTISIFGNAKIQGVNQPGEASVLSATSQTGAISVDGSAEVTGDLSVCGENSSVVISGNPTIAGSSDPNVYGQHIHFGVEPPDFPELDVAPLTALATTVIDSSTNIGSDTVFNNVRIAAGTNPTFSSKVTINGVVYVEAPNDVKFTGGVVLNGLLVTQPSSQPIADCQISFAGHVEAHGVEVLPSTPEFAAVKTQTGTFIVAPGFGVTFAGSFSAINGTIAADQLTFTGTAEGVVCGSVIGLTDRQTSVGGNVDIRVDRRNADPNPAGFVKSLALLPDSQTYSEMIGG